MLMDVFELFLLFLSIFCLHVVSVKREGPQPKFYDYGWVSESDPVFCLSGYPSMQGSSRNLTILAMSVSLIHHACSLLE